MSNFKKSICKFTTCEIHYEDGRVHCLAKLANNNWVAVKKDGSLDWVEINPDDFGAMLESLEGIGVSIRFTNHSAI